MSGPGAAPPETRDMYWLLIATLIGCVVWSFVMLCTEQTAVAIYFAVIAVMFAVLRSKSKT